MDEKERSMTEPLLDENIRQQVREVFEQFVSPVHVLFFQSKNNCEYCDETLKLIEEVASISDMIQLSAHDLDEESELASQYKIDKAPMLVIAAQDGDQIIDYGVRFAGIPAGHEFSSLVHVLVMVSKRDSDLDAATREVLSQLTEPVLLQVFVTPTCPYCPRAVVLAHQMALESPYVQAEMVEAMEFPDLANRYNVSGVPQTTINYGAGTVVGAVPEEDLLTEIQSALISQ